MRRQAWTAIALALLPAALTLAAAGPATAAAAAGSQQRGRSLPVSLTITSIAPTYAVPGQPVIVRGTVTNTSGAPITGMTVRLRSSSTPFASRDGLQFYADGQRFPADFPVPGAATSALRMLAPHVTADWSISVRTRQLGLTQFGVYPLAAEADSAAGTALVTSRTFLPFWPGKRALDPVRQDIAWIWPMINAPQQSACGGLLTNNLAGSFGAAGRLSGLLAAGRDYAARAHLTWSIDPALLSSAQTMSSPYQFGGTAACTDRSSRPASRVAQSWLAGLKTATAGHPVFVTPYADVDVAAMVHRGLNGELARAFAAGRVTATRILGRNFTLAGGAAASGGHAKELPGLAWPADGIANYAVLNSLAVSGVNTVVLGSATMPPSPSQNFTPGAVTTTPSGEGPRMHVLLADDTMTQILGTADRGQASAGPSSFAVSQRFLAETAMIAAERPALARSVVVAPPRDWDPPAPGRPAARQHRHRALAQAGQPAPAGRGRPGPGTSAPQAPAGERQGRTQAGAAGRGQAGIQERRAAAEHPVAAGPGAEPGDHDRGVVGLARHQSRHPPGSPPARPGLRLRVRPGKIGRDHRSATGHPGRPVGHAARVHLERAAVPGAGPAARHAPPGGGRITVTLPPGSVTVGRGADVTLKLHVRAGTVGSTTIQLSLRTPEGAPLPGHPVTLTVQATHFGTLALVIIGAALGVFVLTSVRRALRHGRGEAPAPASGGPDPGDSGGPESTGLAGGADSVVTDRADNEHPPEDPDEYASVPGRTDRR